MAEWSKSIAIEKIGKYAHIMICTDIIDIGNEKVNQQQMNRQAGRIKRGQIIFYKTV